MNIRKKKRRRGEMENNNRKGRVQEKNKDHFDRYVQD
jgi:hypothetical protein